MLTFLQYPKCSTCKKAENWLKAHQADYQSRDIKENNPTKEELMMWKERSGQPLKRFFNTSGLIYRELGLKDRLADMSEEEQFELLSSNGMLVKRPLVIAGDLVLIGFKENEWEEKLNL